MRVEWNDGDLVQLKSGGPIMTVQRKTNSRTNEYRCAWFDENVCLHSSVFQGEALVLVQSITIQLDRIAGNQDLQLSDHFNTGKI